MSDQEAFCIEVNMAEMTKDDWTAFQSAMDSVTEENNKAVAKLAYDLAISESCAMDVFYLRSRSRHTPELEVELIKLHKAGTPPNICDFGHQFKSTAA